MRCESVRESQRFADGRTLTVAGTGPTSDISFAETMRLMVETLSLE
jgi:hypothetical protein